MRIFTTSALAAAICLTASAATPLNMQKQVSADKADAAPLAQTAKKTQTRASDRLPVIETAPEGKVTELTQSGDAYKLFFGKPTPVTYDGIATEIVEGNDGFIYLKNPMSHFTTDSYIKGTKQGDTYVFDLPQNTFEASVKFGVGPDYYLGMLQYDEASQTYLQVNTPEAQEAGLPAAENKLVLKVNADGSISYSSADNDGMIFGLVSHLAGNWLGYAEVKCTWTPFGDTEVTPPAGLTTKQYPCTYTDETTASGGHFVNLGVSGNDVYIQGLFYAMPEAWIKGTRDENNLVSFPNSQYLGYDKTNNANVYATTVQFEPKEDGTGYNLYRSDEFVFTYDPEKDSYTSPGYALLYTPGKEGQTYYYGVFAPVIKPTPENASTTPKDPWEVTFNNGEYPYGPALEFRISDRNVDGDLLNTDLLVYSLYVDGEQYRFTPDNYNSFEITQRYIPFSFSDNYDFFVEGERRKVYFPTREPEKQYGVKLFHLDATGQIIGESNLVTTGTQSIDSLDADKTVDTIKYFDINGMQILQPQGGVFIKVTTYTDGTTTRTKLMK